MSQIMVFAQRIKRFLNHPYFFPLTVILFLFARGVPAFSAEISLNLQMVAAEDKVSIEVSNVGQDPALLVKVKIELDHATYESETVPQVLAGKTHKAQFTVRVPTKPGTYPLFTTVYYQNDGQQLSLSNVGAFNWIKTQELNVDIELPQISLRNEEKVELHIPSGYEFRLVLPDEVRVLKTENIQEGKRYYLKNLRPMFQSTYEIFAVVETADYLSEKRSKVIRSVLHTYKYVEQKSLFSALVYFICGVLGFIIAFVLYLRRVVPAVKQIPDARSIALIRWAFSVFIVSLLFFAFRTLYIVPDHLLEYVKAENFIPSGIPKGLFGNWLQRFVEWVVLGIRVILNWLYFDNDTYVVFSSKIGDPLYLYMLFGNYFVLRYLIKPDPVQDKYWHLMLALFSRFQRKPKTKAHWSPLCKIAILALLVKAFYVPLLPSWAINDIAHQLDLIDNFQGSYEAVNRFLVDLFILIDVSIFAVGYVVELPQLKNQIKSVEPTLLGWTVCLMCYPPFNEFAFQPFDWQLGDFLSLFGVSYVHQWQAPVNLVRAIGLGLVTVLWGIYMWATIALGWKSSNLTNRGIVSSGPYAIVRHPAYISKTALWAVEAIIYGNKFFFLIVAFLAVYGLRAWTEERHLSRDPDYLLYKKKVRWCFIPLIY